MTVLVAVVVRVAGTVGGVCRVGDGVAVWVGRGDRVGLVGTVCVGMSVLVGVELAGTRVFVAGVGLFVDVPGGG